MAVDLAKLAIRVESLEAKQAANDLARLERQGKKTETATAGLSKAAKRLAVALGGLLAAGAVARAFAEASAQARKFEDSIAELSAITGLTGDKLRVIEKAAADFGRTTTLSATQAAEAFKLVASTQPQLLKFPDQLSKVTEAAIVLAEATGSTLPDAADTLGQSLNQFGLDADEASRVINVLAAGAQKGASFVNETAEALKFAGTVAASVGVSFESTNAAIQSLSTVGIKASEAGTALRNILLKLEGQTNTQFKPSIQGFEQALINLRDSEISLTEQTELFGLRSVVAANALISQAPAVAALTEEITDQTTAYEQQATKVDTLEGSVKALRSAQEGLQIRIGSELNPTVRTLTDTLTDATNAFTDFLGEVEAEEGTGKLDFALKGIIKILFRLGVEFTDLGDLIGAWGAQTATALELPGIGLKTLAVIVVSFFDQLGTYIQGALIQFVDLGDAIGAFAAATKARLTLDFDLADQIMLARQETAAAVEEELNGLREKRELIGQVRQAAIDEGVAAIEGAEARFAAIGQEREARRAALEEEIAAFNSKIDFGTEANAVASEGVAITEAQTEAQRAANEEAERAAEFARRQAEIQSNQTELDEISDPYRTDVEAAEDAAAEQLAILERLGQDSVALTEEQEQQRIETIERINEELAQVREDAHQAELEAEQRRQEELAEQRLAQREFEALAIEDEVERQIELEEIRHEERLEAMIRRAEERGVLQETIDKAVEAMEQRHQDRMEAIRAKAGRKQNKFDEFLAKSKVDTALKEGVRLTQGVAQHNKTMFRINKALGIADAVISTYKGVARALAEYAPPLSFVMAAAQLAAGLAQVAAIRSTQYEGGGGGTTPSLAGSTPTYNGQPVSPNEPPVNDDLINPPDASDGTETRTSVVVTGNVGFTPDIIDEIAEGLREATGERDVVIFDENSRQAQDIVQVADDGTS